MKNGKMKKHFYGVSSKYEFGAWGHVIYKFESVEAAKKWLHTEESDFRERELMTRKDAECLAGKKAVATAIEFERF